MSEWRVSTWGDEVTLEYGKGIRGYADADGSVRVFGTNGPVGWTDKPLADGPGVILGRKGAYRGVHYSPDPFFVIDTAYYALAKSPLNMRWLYYAMIYHELGKIDDGSPIPSTTRAAVYPRELLVPPIEEQVAIAAVLGALDDKIEQNRRTGQALERLARETFKAWFVDFEPVKAKAAGAASFPGMPSAAFAALPDRLTDSPLGPVPEGWVEGTMGDVGEQRRDQIAPGEVDGETPYIGLEHIPRGDIALCEWGAAASVISSKFRFHRGDILFGKLRPYFHKVGPAPLGGVCSTDIVVLYSKRPEYAAWLLMLVSSNDFVAHADRSSAGTKMPRTNWNDMAAFATTVPPSALGSAFQEQAGPMLDLIAASIYEARKLAILRDYLLPRLLSGQVRVRPLDWDVQP